MPAYNTGQFYAKVTGSFPPATLAKLMLPPISPRTRDWAQAQVRIKRHSRLLVTLRNTSSLLIYLLAYFIYPKVLYLSSSIMIIRQLSQVNSSALIPSKICASPAHTSIPDHYYWAFTHITGYTDTQKERIRTKETQTVPYSSYSRVRVLGIGDSLEFESR